MKKISVLLAVLFGSSLQVSSCFAQIITTFAGTGTIGYTGDVGPASAAELKTPSGVAVDRRGNVYITDQNGSCVRKVDTTGVITSVAGNSGAPGYSGDGGPATAAKLNWPEGVTTDDSGNVYIADQFNNVIRKVNAATGIITTFAGSNALIGYSGDGGPATGAALWHPSDVGVDHSGNVYFVDQDNSVVRKVSAGAGIITTAAGVDTAGYSGDGGAATAARLNFPEGIAVDSAGDVFVADFYNSRIRKINAATGIITTVAGNGTAGYMGDGGPATNAELYDASAVALDDSGNIYISDYYNSVIRKVSAATGIITTIAGNGTAAYCCDCSAATAAEIYYPEGVAADSRGNVYIADFDNARVRKVSNTHCHTLTLPQQVAAQVAEIFPNPSAGQFCIRTSGKETFEKGEIYNAMGEKIYECDFNLQITNIDLVYVPDGVYFIHLISKERCDVQKIVISR